jgi:nitroreductase
MEVEKAIRTRRTHKAFGALELEPEVIEELIELARWAPNHHLTNPWRFRLIGARTRARLMELAEAEKPGAAVKLQRAPTLIAVSARMSGEAAQDREDLLATAVAAYLVLLGAHARPGRLLAHGRSARLRRGPRPAGPRPGRDPGRDPLPRRPAAGAARARARTRRGDPQPPRLSAARYRGRVSMASLFTLAAPPLLAAARGRR